MKPDELQPSDSFVLRIWWEEDAQPVWRGWVRHTSTGEAFYFRRLADLLAFVEAHTGPLARHPHSRATQIGDEIIDP